MCVMSMIGDHYRDRWRDRFREQEWWPNVPMWPPGPAMPMPVTLPQPSPITRQQFDDLKREVMEMKELLKRAKKYDEDNNQRDCEVDEKMDLLRKIAAMVGISLDDVIKPAGK